MLKPHWTDGQFWQSVVDEGLRWFEGLAGWPEPALAGAGVWDPGKGSIMGRLASEGSSWNPDDAKLKALLDRLRDTPTAPYVPLRVTSKPEPQSSLPDLLESLKSDPPPLRRAAEADPPAQTAGFWGTWFGRLRRR